MKRTGLGTALITLVGVVLMIVLIGDAAHAASGTITSPAGNNTFCGDGGAPASACLNLPVGVTFDSLGNLYIADNSNQRIRKVTPGGSPIITTFAGDGLGRFAGDGGPATAASLNFPIAIAADSGNMYIADSTNDRVRKISGGNITTFAGGTTGVGCTNNGILATAACLSSPRGLAVFGGKLYISDALHNEIRSVDLTTNVINTFAGIGGTAGFSGDGGAATGARLNHPRGIRFDSAGNLFIADENNNRIRRVDVALNISTVAGSSATPGFSGDGGAATAALLSHPRGVALDASNNLLIADSDNDEVRKVVNGGDGFVNGGAGENIAAFAGNHTSTFCGDGAAATAACVNSPDDLAFETSTGNLFIAAPLNHRIRVVTPGGTISTFAGSQTFCGDGGVATAACLNNPQGIERQSATGPMYISDTVNHRIRVVNGTTVTTLAGNGTPGFSGDGGPASSAALYSPRGLAANAAGDLYIADTTNNRIRRIDHVTQNISTVAGTGVLGFTGDAGAAVSAALNLPRDVFIDASGNLYIADTGNNVIRKVVTGGDGVVNGNAGETISTIAGSLAGTAGDCINGSLATTACLNGPQGIFVETATGNLVIADNANNKVKKLAIATNQFSTIAGTGSTLEGADGALATVTGIHEPTSVVEDAAGNLFISSHSGDRVRRVDAATQLVSTIAGGAVTGFCGDGGLASAGCLTLPRAITLDTSGNLYIADQGNRRIRKVEAAGVPPPTPTPAPVVLGGVDSDAASEHSTPANNAAPDRENRSRTAAIAILTGGALSTLFGSVAFALVRRRERRRPR